MKRARYLIVSHVVKAGVWTLDLEEKHRNNLKNKQRSCKQEYIKEKTNEEIKKRKKNDRKQNKTRKVGLKDQNLAKGKKIGKLWKVK